MRQVIFQFEFLNIRELSDAIVYIYDYNRLHFFKITINLYLNIHNYLIILIMILKSF